MPTLSFHSCGLCCWLIASVKAHSRACSFSLRLSGFLPPPSPLCHQASGGDSFPLCASHPGLVSRNPVRVFVNNSITELPSWIPGPCRWFLISIVSVHRKEKRAPCRSAVAFMIPAKPAHVWAASTRPACFC